MDQDQAEPADPLDAEVVAGGCELNSKKGHERRDTHREALHARQGRDIDGMFAAYRTAVEERNEAERMWLTALGTMTGKLPPELMQASPVEAIRDVALAAIQLARDVALRESPTGREAAGDHDSARGA